MRILLVEDNSDHRELMRLALTGHDSTWEVEAVESGEEVLCHLAEREAYDVVFLDYSLPGRDGLEVLEEIRRGEAPPPVVMVTGRGDERVAVEAMKGGAYDYVVKGEGYLQRLPVVARHALEAQQLAVERKRAEEALRESEEKYRNVVERANDGITIIQDTIVKYLNSRMAEMWGGNVEEIVGTPFTNYVHPDELSKVVDRHKRRMAGEDVTPIYETVLRRKDGSEAYAELNAGVITFQGKPADLVIVRDITERKQAEETLRLAEENFRRSLDDSPLGVRIVTIEGETVYTNRAMLNIYGYDSIEELRTTPLKERYTPESYAEFQIRKEKRRQGEYDPFEYEASIVRKNGEVRHLQVFRKEILWNGERQFQTIYQDITERKRAEKALRENEERLRTIVEASLDAIIAVNTEGQLVLFNGAAQELFQYSEEEALNQPANILLREEIGKIHQERLERFLNTGVGQCGHIGRRVERLFRRKDGSLFEAEVSMSGGRLDGLRLVVLAIHDITSRKQTEKALQESEIKYRSIFDNAVEGISQVTPEGRFISVNPALARMAGYDSPEEMIKSITNIGNQLYVNPEDRVRYKKVLEKQGIIEGFEAQHYRKDGNIIWGSINARAVKDEADKVLYYEGTVEDITERKQAEIALIESESKFKNLVEESIAGVYIIQDGVFKYVNQRCAEIHDYTVEEMVGRLGPKETILPDDLPIVEENIRKRLSGETVTVHFTFRVVRKDKKVVHIEVYGSSMMYQGKPAIIGTLIDITERKQAEEALQQSEEKHRVLIETTDTGYLILDAQGRVIDANKEYIRLTGYAALEEILGRGVVEWTAPYDLERNAAEVKRCVEQGYVRNLEIDYVNRSGQITPIELNATVMGSGDSARILSLCRDITDRRRTEQKLKESEKKYRSIFENTVEGIFQTTPEGRYLSVNPALARMAGYDSPEEMIKSITNIGNQLYVNPEDRVRYKKVLEKQGIIEGFEAQHYRKDRSIIWVSINARAVKDKAGKLLYYEGTIEDITERKRAETALKESENRYRAIFENTGTATIIVEEDTTISLANTEAERLTGYKKEEIEGKKSWTEFIVKEDLERMIASHKLRRINPDAALKNYEFKLIDRYGNQKDILLTVDMILGTKRSVASLIDITERKRAEDALKRAEEKYRNIFENAMVGIYQSTQEGRYLSVNPAMARIFGYSSPEEMIKTITDTGLQTYVNPDDRIRFKKLLESGEVVGGFETQRYRKDKGKFWVSINNRAVFDESGKVFYYEGIVEDITARKLAEDNLRSSLHEKEVLLKEIHHRVKNNLTVISSIMSLQSRYMKDDTSREIFRECENRVRTMAMIHTKLYQSKDFAHINFGFYIKELTHDLFYSYGVDPDAITLTIDVADTPIDINIAIPLGLLLNELLSNAIKYAFPEGRKGEIIVTLHSKDGNIILTIADDGIGFPETIDFRDTQSLGLQLVMALIQQLDATIELNRDKGTIFTVTFWKEGG